MLFSFKKYSPFLCFLFVCVLMQCSQSTTTDKNTDDNLTQKDSIDLIQKKDTASIQSNSYSTTEKLPDWPIKAIIEKGKRYPFDEAPKDPSFVTFRGKLYQSIIEKDLNFLSSVIHDSIKFSFGTENGKEDFLKTWKLDSNPNNSDLWSELETVLQLGGAFKHYSKNSFYAPYIFVLEDITDPYMEAVIIGENVRLRDQPSSQAKISGSLGWDLVEVIYEDNLIEETINGESHTWQKVKTASGDTGYIFGKYVRFPIDFRAGFSKYDEKWMMDLFIAGD